MKTKNLTVLAVMTALSVILAVTPLGFIPVGPVAATTIHIPVIIVAVLYGRKMGAAMGLIFGLISFTRAYLAPSPVSFIMMDPRVSVVPRLLMGYLVGLLFEKIKDLDAKRLKQIAAVVLVLFASALAYKIFNYIKAQNTAAVVAFTVILLLFVLAGYFLLKNKENEKKIASFVSAVFGTAFNTFSFLSMLYILYGAKYLTAIGMSENLALPAVLAIGAVNGTAEVVLASLIVPAVVSRVRIVLKRS